MNKFDAYITDYLYGHKEVSLERIGTVKANGSLPAPTGESPAVTFIFDKKATTTPELIDFIAEQAKKNKMLIASDLESHFAQVREFINIGKNYEIPEIGFIKANKTGTYEFLPYSEATKSIRITTQPIERDKIPKTSNRSFVQVITLIIVLAIIAGLGYEAYQFFIKKQPETAEVTPATDDTTNAATVKDTTKVDSNTIKAAAQTKTYISTDTVNVRYIFETTASGLRAKTRTVQLKGFGNNAGYDSAMVNNTMYYSLYILKATQLSDTARVRDSIGKFLQKDIKIELVK